MSEVVKLVKDARYRATVMDVTPCGGGYPGTGTNSGKYYNCHHLIVRVDQFPDELFKVQICDLNAGFNLLEVNDYFVFVASTYKMAEDRYTIKFESKAVPHSPKRETIGAQAQVQSTPKASYPQTEYVQPKLEQAVAGTKWSICLTAAKDFHKDRKGSGDEDVIKTLKYYMRSFNEYQASEEDYLKESK